MATKNDLFVYIRDNYGTEPDFPFKDDIAIFRQKGNRKWYAAVMFKLDKRKLGIDVDGKCDVVNLKCDPVKSRPYRQIKGILPGYHMNKQHWLTVMLDGTVKSSVLQELVDVSYQLTAPKFKK